MYTDLNKSEVQITENSLVNLKCCILSVLPFLHGYNITWYQIWVPGFQNAFAVVV